MRLDLKLSNVCSLMNMVTLTELQWPIERKLSIVPRSKLVMLIYIGN